MGSRYTRMLRWKVVLATLLTCIGVGCGGATVGTGLRYGDGNSTGNPAQFTLLTLQGVIQGGVPERIKAESSAGTASARPDSSGGFLLVLKRVGNEPIRLTLEFDGSEVPVAVQGIPEGSKKSSVVLKGSEKTGFSVQVK